MRLIDFCTNFNILMAYLRKFQALFQIIAEVRFGVPQRSNLGPHVTRIYIIDQYERVYATLPSRCETVTSPDKFQGVKRRKGTFINFFLIPARHNVTLT